MSLDQLAVPAPVKMVRIARGPLRLKQAAEEGQEQNDEVDEPAPEVMRTMSLPNRVK